MFETHESAIAHVDEFYSDPNERFWHYVKLPLHIAWFHVTLDYFTNGSERLSKMLFLTRPEQLVDLSHTDGLQIRMVDLVTPGHMNGTSRWSMEPLAEVLRGTEITRFGSQRAYIYVTSKGNRYLKAGCATKERDIQDLSVIYRN